MFENSFRHQNILKKHDIFDFQPTIHQFVRPATKRKPQPEHVDTPEEAHVERECKPASVILNSATPSPTPPTATTTTSATNSTNNHNKSDNNNITATDNHISNNGECDTKGFQPKAITASILSQLRRVPQKPHPNFAGTQSKVAKAFSAFDPLNATTWLTYMAEQVKKETENCKIGRASDSKGKKHKSNKAGKREKVHKSTKHHDIPSENDDDSPMSSSSDDDDKVGSSSSDDDDAESVGLIDKIVDHDFDKLGQYTVKIRWEGHYPLFKSNNTFLPENELQKKPVEFLKEALRRANITPQRKKTDIIEQLRGVKVPWPEEWEAISVLDKQTGSLSRDAVLGDSKLWREKASAWAAVPKNQKKLESLPKDAPIFNHLELPSPKTAAYIT